LRILLTGWRKADAEHRQRIADTMLRAYQLCLDVAPAPDGDDDAWYMSPNIVGYRIERPTLVHGACKSGVDIIGELIAKSWNWAIERHPAQGHPEQDFGPWPGCGPRRSKYMVSLGADICAALPGPDSRGTNRCIEYARDALMPVYIKPLK
jgi:hypothetical protein